MLSPSLRAVPLRHCESIILRARSVKVLQPFKVFRLRVVAIEEVATHQERGERPRTVWMPKARTHCHRLPWREEKLTSSCSNVSSLFARIYSDPLKRLLVTAGLADSQDRFFDTHVILSIITI